MGKFLTVVLPLVFLLSGVSYAGEIQFYSNGASAPDKEYSGPTYHYDVRPGIVQFYSNGASAPTDYYDYNSHPTYHYNVRPGEVQFYSNGAAAPGSYTSGGYYYSYGQPQTARYVANQWYWQPAGYYWLFDGNSGRYVYYYPSTGAYAYASVPQ